MRPDPRPAAIAFLALGLTACSKPPAAEMVIVAGQSNALGYKVLRAELPPELARPDPGVQIWSGERFVVMEPGRNTGLRNQPESWGPEVGFAHAWRLAHPERTLYIVKVARGSTPLAASPGPDWAPASGEHFADTASAVIAARQALANAGLKPKVAAVLWVQGESDAADPAKAAAYEANLRDLLTQIRDRWAERRTPVVLARIPNWGGHATQVRAAQAAVDAADPRTVAVDTVGLPMQADGLHIAAPGQLRLGEAMARAADGLTRQE